MNKKNTPNINLSKYPNTTHIKKMHCTPYPSIKKKILTPSKSSVVGSEARGDLEKKVDKLLAVAKSGQMGNGKDKRDRSRTPKTTFTKSRQGTPTKRENEQDIRNSLQGPGVNASAPFENGQKPIQCFKCKEWGHPRRLCPSHFNYTRGGMAREPPSPAREEMRQPPSSNPNT